MMEDGIQALEPVDRETLQSKVTRVLREAILNGQLKPNQRLIEEEISQQLGVSRVPVREAIAALEKDGLVVRKYGRGAHVAHPRRTDVEEIYGLRLALERYALKIAFDKINAEQLNDLKRLTQTMFTCVEENDIVQLMQVDLAFHETLCKIAGNQRLIDVWRSQVSQLHMLLAWIGSLKDDFRDMVEGHERILNALQHEDLESAQSQLERAICFCRNLLLSVVHEEGE